MKGQQTKASCHYLKFFQALMKLLKLKIHEEMLNLQFKI